MRRKISKNCTYTYTVPTGLILCKYSQKLYQYLFFFSFDSHFLDPDELAAKVSDVFIVLQMFYKVITG